MILIDYQGFLKGAAIAAVASLGLVLAQPALARDAPQSFAVRSKGNAFTTSLGAGSVATYVW